jgi:hypothetical protein
MFLNFPRFFSSLHTKAAFAYSSLPLYSPLAAACPFPSVGVGIWPKQSVGSRNSCSFFWFNLWARSDTKVVGNQGGACGALVWSSSAMRPDARLDAAVFQLTPTRTRWEHPRSAQQEALIWRIFAFFGLLFSLYEARTVCPMLLDKKERA